MTPSTAIAIVAAVIAPIAAYLMAARQFSGKVETSSATDLWTESRSIRKWATEHIKELNATVERLEKRVSDLEHRNADLYLENVQLERELAVCREAS